MIIISVTNWLEKHQSPCLYKKIFGIECPGCGTQTALIHLFKGEFIKSFIAFPALMPMLVMIIYLILFLIFKFKNGLLILKILFIFTSLVMLTGYIFKIINN